MMQPTARLAWHFLDVIGLPLDGYPAAKVNRNGVDSYYILKQWWQNGEGRGEWRPVRFASREEEYGT